MANLKARQNRNVHVLKTILENPINFVKVSAVFKTAENDAASPFKTSCQFHLR